MRGTQVIGTALLFLALGAASDAEARGRGVRAGLRGATIGSAAVAATGSIGAGPARADSSGATPRPPVAAPAPPVRAVSATAPWCASRRVVGTGAGFCVIN